MTWSDGRLCAFDTETTGEDPQTARIVAAALAFVGGGRPTEVFTLLVDPGVEIPAQATAIHGITSEHARAHGRGAAEATAMIARRLGDTWSAGVPVVGFNIGYDLTVLDRELRRHHGAPLTVSGPVVDPHVIDRALDRRRGRRTLEESCRYYGVRHGGAHDATQDALAAARLAWRLARRYPAEVGEVSLARLFDRQVEWSRQWATRLTAYLRSRGQDETVDGTWPIRRLAGASRPERPPA
ncbi:3'-5' exonuclease [Streptosporangium violaceochromogenes]|nr:3'-5' exonuclease [Streptosporangium violaceochromogenes]